MHPTARPCLESLEPGCPVLMTPAHLKFVVCCGGSRFVLWRYCCQHPAYLVQSFRLLPLVGLGTHARMEAASPHLCQDLQDAEVRLLEAAVLLKKAPATHPLAAGISNPFRVHTGKLCRLTCCFLYSHCNRNFSQESYHSCHSSHKSAKQKRGWNGTAVSSMCEPDMDNLAPDIDNLPQAHTL